MEVSLLATPSHINYTHLFWDTDALSAVYSDKEGKILQTIVNAYPNTNYWLSTPNCIEFYNSDPGPDKIFLKQSFLSAQSPFFRHFIPDKSFIDKQTPNILLLKRMYIALNWGGSPSYEDLYLQATNMVLGSSAAIITGNITDYNQKIFDVEKVITYFNIRNLKNKRS